MTLAENMIGQPPKGSSKRGSWIVGDRVDFRQTISQRGVDFHGDIPLHAMGYPRGCKAHSEQKYPTIRHGFSFNYTVWPPLVFCPKLGHCFVEVTLASSGQDPQIPSNPREAFYI